MSDPFFSDSSSSRTAEAAGHAAFVRAMNRLRKQGKEPSLEEIYQEMENHPDSPPQRQAAPMVKTEPAGMQSPAVQFSPPSAPDPGGSLAEIEALRRELTEERAFRDREYASLHSRYQEARSRIEELEGLAQEARLELLQVERLRSLLSTQKADLDASLRRNDEIEEKLHEARREAGQIAQWKERDAIREEAILSLRRREEELVHQLNEERQRHLEAKSVIEQWEAERLSAPSTEDLSARLEASEKLRFGMEEELSVLRKRTAGLTSQLEILKHREEEQSAAKQVLQKKLSEWQESARQNDISSGQLSQKLQEAEEALEEAERWKVSMQERLAVLERAEAEKQELETLWQNLEERNRQQNETLATLNQELAAMAAGRDAFSRREEELTGRLRLAEEELEHMRSRSREEKLILEKQIEEMKGELAEARRVSSLESGGDAHLAHLLTRIAEMEPELEELRKMKPAFKDQIRTVRNQENIIQNLQRRLAAAESGENQAAPAPVAAPAAPVIPAADWSEVAKSVPRRSRAPVWLAVALLFLLGGTLGGFWIALRYGPSIAVAFGFGEEESNHVTDPADLFFGNEPARFAPPSFLFEPGTFSDSPQRIWNPQQGETTLPLAGLFNPNGQFDFHLLQQIWNESQQGKLAPRPANSVIAELREGFDQTRELADEGDAEMQYILALRLMVSAFTSYRNGLDASDPLREAYSWLQKSAKGGNADALYVGGQMRRLGVGVRADPDKGRAVIAFAAAAGQPDAQEFLGVEYLNLYFQTRVEEYARTSAANFKAAAEQGRPLGELMYGRFLTEGLGVPQDLTRGVDWLARAYRNGQTDALIYLQDAAEAGSSTARSALAELDPSRSIGSGLESP